MSYITKKKKNIATLYCNSLIYHSDKNIFNRLIISKFPKYLFFLGFILLETIWFDLISVSRKARFRSRISRGYFTSLVTDNRIIVVTQLIELCRLTRVITRKTIRNGRAVADKHEMHTRRHRGTRCHFYFNRSTDWNKFS